MKTAENANPKGFHAKGHVSADLREEVPIFQRPPGRVWPKLPAAKVARLLAVANTRAQRVVVFRVGMFGESFERASTLADVTPARAAELWKSAKVRESEITRILKVEKQLAENA